MGCTTPMQDKSSSFSGPLLVHSSQFMIMSFKVPLAKVEEFMPNGIAGLADENGDTNFTFEMYQSDYVSGVNNFKAFFIVVDVPGTKSRSGIEPHMPIWGVINGEDALKHFVNTFNYPYSDKKALQFSNQGNIFQANVSQGEKSLFNVSMTIDRNIPVSVSGAVDIVGFSSGEGVKSEVPFITRGYDIKALSFDIDDDAPEVLKLIKSLKPQWAMVATDQQFAYSGPRRFLLKKN